MGLNVAWNEKKMGDKWGKSGMYLQFFNVRQRSGFAISTRSVFWQAGSYMFRCSDFLAVLKKKIDTISIPFRYIYWILFFTPYYRVRVRSGFAFQVGSSILFRNGIYLPKFSDLLWEKNFLVIKKNFRNSRLKAENLQNVWDH